MTYWMVTLNGVPLRRWMDKDEAYAMAERWQGSHCRYSGASGLLKIKDRGDHVEVKEDKAATAEFNERYKVAKAGDRQRVVFEQRVDDTVADPAMGG